MSEHLTPSGAYQVVDSPTQWRQPSLTYKVDYEIDSQIRGYCDDIRAMEQAVYKIINTERYAYLIYSWNYGIELADLFGQPIPYVYAELQRRFEEALLADDRIKAVRNFDFSHVGGDVRMTFDVVTNIGVLKGITKEVNGIV